MNADTPRQEQGEGVEQRARELLAAEYEAAGWHNSAAAVLGNRMVDSQVFSIRAIVAALSAAKPQEGVPRAIHLLGDMKRRWLDAADGYREAGIVYADQLLRDAVDEIDHVAATLTARQTAESTTGRPWAQEWQPTPCPTCEGFCGDVGMTCAEDSAAKEANKAHQYRLREDPSGAWYDEGTGPTPDAWHHDCVVPDHIWRTLYKTSEKDHE